MIRFTCPQCDTPFAVDDSKAGKASPCPKCGWKLRVPFPEVPRAVVLEEATGKRKRPRSPRDGSPDEPPRGRVCPYCDSRLPPHVRSKISAAGYVLTAVTALFFLGLSAAGLCVCWPLCLAALLVPFSFLGLFIKTEYVACAECGRQLD